MWHNCLKWEAPRNCLHQDDWKTLWDRSWWNFIGFFWHDEETTENLWFEDRNGKIMRLVNYFTGHYGYDIQLRSFPCLLIGRSEPCYLPMDLCMICKGQNFLGKLSDDKTTRMLKMGCQRSRKRKVIIDKVLKYIGKHSKLSGICQKFSWESPDSMQKKDGDREVNEVCNPCLETLAKHVILAI